MKKLKCKKCKHEWIARTAPVKQCPKCKTYYWKAGKGKVNEQKA
jgi:Zn finger protein HypA/HybF involved in hydrogenase expression